MPRARPWSQSDDDVLRRDYGTVSRSVLAARLDRSISNVEQRAGKLGLRDSAPKESLPSTAERLLTRLKIHGEKCEWEIVGELLAAWELSTGVEPLRSGDSPIAELGLPTRLVNALESRGYLYAADLAGATEEEIRSIPNLGTQAWSAIRTQLGVHGLLAQAIAASIEQLGEG